MIVFQYSKVAGKFIFGLHIKDRIHYRINGSLNETRLSRSFSDFYTENRNTHVQTFKLELIY